MMVQGCSAEAGAAPCSFYIKMFADRVLFTPRAKTSYSCAWITTTKVDQVKHPDQALGACGAVNLWPLLDSASRHRMRLTVVIIAAEDICTRLRRTVHELCSASATAHPEKGARLRQEDKVQCENERS